MYRYVNKSLLIPMLTAFFILLTQTKKIFFITFPANPIKFRFGSDVLRCVWVMSVYARRRGCLKIRNRKYMTWILFNAKIVYYFKNIRLLWSILVHYLFGSLHYFEALKFKGIFWQSIPCGYFIMDCWKLQNKAYVKIRT